MDGWRANLAIFRDALMSRTFISFVFAVLSFIFWGCEGVNQHEGGAVRVKIGATELDIPRDYVLPSFPTSIVGSSDGSDGGVMINVSFPYTDLGLPRGGSPGAQRVTSLLSKIDVRYLSSALPIDAENAWLGHRLYASRRIEEDEYSNLVRIYPDSGYPKIWQYFDKQPTGKVAQYADWVAGCRVGPFDEEKENLENVLCNRTIFVAGIQCKFFFSGNYLSDIEVLDRGITNLIRSWVVTR